MGVQAGARLGRYQLLAPIGAGGMGEVWRARDTRLGREVAVKLLPAALCAHPERLRRFEQEARAAGALNHPNILALHDLGTEQEVPYLVFELLEGETLRDRIRAGRLPLRQAFDVAVQVARGLAAAHDKGIVHRDLKPENLFLTRDGRAKILDFGLAKLGDPPGLDPAIAEETTLALGTEPGVVLGTMGYMSPEQVRGLAVDHRTDVFSFGAILYEMLSGRRAFRGASEADTMSAILREEPPAIGEGEATLAALERIARRCLEKRPEERFQSARDLVFALEAVSGPVPRAPSAAAAAPGVGPPRSIAVLLFKDLTGDPQNAHLGVGLADAIITELAQLRSLTVRPTASILRYQERAVAPEQAGRELQVGAVVDGSFQRVGSRLRVTVQLVDTAEARPLWGAKIDTSIDDLFRMQDEVSRQIARALAVELAPGSSAPGSGPSEGAYELYLRGKFHLHRDGREEVEAAIRSFERATALDPGFALAWAGLSEAYCALAFAYEPEGDWHARAEEICRKALALDPELPEGRYLRARLIWHPQVGFDHAGALRELEAALRARPSMDGALHLLGVVLSHVGLLEEAARALERALEIDPERHTSAGILAHCRYLQGRFGEALELAEATTRRARNAWASYQAALSRIQLGQLGEARHTIDLASRQFPDEVLFHPVRGLIGARSGDAAEARRQVTLTEENRRSFGHYHHAQYDLACIHALLGDTDLALERLAQAVRNGFPCHPWIARDPLLASLRGDPRYASLLGEVEAECAGYHRLLAELRASRAE